MYSSIHTDLKKKQNKNKLYLISNVIIYYIIFIYYNSNVFIITFFV